MNSKSYTLIELIIVIVVIAILSSLFGVFIMKGFDAWVFIKSRESAVGSARHSVNRMVAELKRIRMPSQITTMTTSECSFLDVNLTQVDFKQTGTDLYRNTDIMATGLDSPGGLVFAYLDASGNVTTVKQNVRIVRVRLSLVKNSQPIVIESSAAIRNLI